MRVLVVEDNPDHMKAAIEIINAAGHEVIQAANFFDALEHLRRWPIVEGVITDLFIPEDSCSKEAEQPRGLGVALLAEKSRIPFVICTAGYHHGTKYNWICFLGRELGWEEMVDQLHDKKDYEAESPNKDWTTALDDLLRLVQQRK